MDKLTKEQKKVLEDILLDGESLGWDHIASVFNSKTGLNITGNQVYTFYLRQELGF